MALVVLSRQESLDQLGHTVRDVDPTAPPTENTSNALTCIKCISTAMCDGNVHSAGATVQNHVGDPNCPTFSVTAAPRFTTYSGMNHFTDNVTLSVIMLVTTNCMQLLQCSTACRSGSDATYGPQRNKLQPWKLWHKDSP